MCKHKHSLSVSPYIFLIEDKIKDGLANWPFYNVFFLTFFVLLQLCLYTRSNEHFRSIIVRPVTCVKPTPYLSLISHAHALQTSGFRVQLPSRLLKGQEVPWSSSESALTFIHLGACWSHTQCKLVFLWVSLLPPHLLTSVGVCTSAQLTQKAGWIPHQEQWCRGEELTWPYKLWGFNQSFL